MDHYEPHGISIFSISGEEAVCQTSNHNPSYLDGPGHYYDDAGGLPQSYTSKPADAEELSDIYRAYSPIPLERVEAWPTSMLSNIFHEPTEQNSWAYSEEVPPSPQEPHLRTFNKKRHPTYVNGEGRPRVKKFANAVPRIVQKRQDAPKLPKRPLSAINIHQREIRAKSLAVETLPPKAYWQNETYGKYLPEEKLGQYEMMEKAERERYLLESTQFYNDLNPSEQFHHKQFSPPSHTHTSAFSPTMGNALPQVSHSFVPCPQEGHYTPYPTTRFPEPILLHGPPRGGPVQVPPPHLVELLDASGRPRRYHVMYAAITMPVEDAQKYLSSLNATR